MSIILKQTAFLSLRKYRLDPVIQEMTTTKGWLGHLRRRRRHMDQGLGVEGDGEREEEDRAENSAMP